MDLKGWAHYDNGDPVPNADVTIYNAATSATVDTTTTDASGVWESLGLADGVTYDVKIDKDGVVRWIMGGEKHQLAELALAGTILPSGLVVPNGTAFPGSPETGRFFYRTDQDTMYRYSGSAWIPLADVSKAIAFAAAL